MPAELAYPLSLYGPAPFVDLSDRAERVRLSASAAKAFFNIVDHWQVRDEDARLLLGGMSNGAYYELKKSPDRLVDEDRLYRVSYLIGIFKALNLLYSEALADRWMHLPNRNRLFTGQTPLTYVIKGGMPALLTLRRLLDARRGSV